MLVCITVASNLLMLLLLNALNSKARIWEQEFDILYERKLNCKFANLKYEETEDPSVHALKEKIRELKNMSGKGLYSYCRRSGRSSNPPFSVAGCGISCISAVYILRQFRKTAGT